MTTNKLIKVIDFWLTSSRSGPLYPRELADRLEYKGREIVDLVGPRRSGKSSILKLLIKRLELTDEYLFINFEDPFFIEFNEPQVIEELIDVFKTHFNKNLRYVFFDEIQEIKNWEKALRKLRDGTDYKIFVTGSSSKLLSSEISSSITGRHFSYDVYPVSFAEFLSFYSIDIGSVKDMALNESVLLKKWHEYLALGGFPEVVITQKKELLKNYFLDMLQKDIVMRHNIREKEILERMAVYLLSQVGKPVPIAALKKIFDISYQSASRYLSYLQEAFLVFELPQFSYSLKTQQKSLKKIYAIDTGLASAVSFKFSEDRGRMLENIVFLALLRQKKELYYYKTKNNREVDFLVKDNQTAEILIQVCWDLSNESTRKREVRGLVEAMEEFDMSEGLILTDDEEGVIKEGNKVINIKPAYKWVLEQDLR